MKKYILSLATLAFLASCQSAPEGQEASTTQQKEASKSESGTSYTIDQTTSLVTFVGTKPVGTHTGTFALTSGNLKVDNGNITAGSFEIDIQRSGTMRNARSADQSTLASCGTIDTP